MSTVAGILIGLGCMFVFLGAYFLYVHYKRPVPNDEYEWVGFGDHPFRRNL